MHPFAISIIFKFVRSSFGQTTSLLSLLCLVSHPHFAAIVATTGFHFELIVHMLYLHSLKDVVADPPPPPLKKPSGDIAAAPTVESLDFEAMAAKQKRCPET
jgi:hypothetical protein